MSQFIPDQVAQLLAEALTTLIGKAEPAAMVFLRCLPSGVVGALADDERFTVEGWTVRAVGASHDAARRRITADAAVEIREDKGDAMLLLVDVQNAGAGMDGIYSAAREVQEMELFETACKQARKKISKSVRDFSDEAIRLARKQAKPQGLAPWQEFVYWCQVVGSDDACGTALPAIGLWPVAVGEEPNNEHLEHSARLVERLLPIRGTGQGPEARVEALNLPPGQEEFKMDLTRLLREAERLPRPEALTLLAEHAEFQLNTLSPGIFTEQNLERIEWIEWRGKTGKLLAWSGLTQGEDWPELRLSLDADNPQTRKLLEVRWACFPDSLKKGCVDFVVDVMTGDDVLTSRTLSHNGKAEQRCIFSPEDFSGLPENSSLTAKVEIRALGQEGIIAESENFEICFGEPDGDESAPTAGIVYPTLALAAIQVAPDIEAWNRLVSEPDGVHFKFDKGHVSCQFKDKGKTKAARVICPPLIQRLADDWFAYNGQPGRWKVVVRVDGSEASLPTFIPIKAEGSEGERFAKMSKAFADKLKSGRGPLGVLYGDVSWITDYVNAATAWWESEQIAPEASLIHTLEVVDQNGKNQGAIVLPTHPLRVAWQQGFDQLAMFHRYKEGQAPRTVANLLEGLVSTNFPAFLPGFAAGETLVFGDSLGFHAAAMVRADDREPKTTVALLARLLGGSGSDDTLAPTVGRGAADLLASEIGRYLTLHPDAQRVLLQAIGAGDGLTVARALGKARELAESQGESAEDESEVPHPELAFELDFHAVGDHRAEWSGRFLATTAEKGRNSPSRVLQQDRWLLESVQRPGGVTLPRLKWARRDKKQPDDAAHIALVFDAFPSSVVAASVSDAIGSFEAHGLAMSPDRQFEVKDGVATWRVQVPTEFDGEKHPAAPVLSARLVKSHTAVLVAVARWLGGGRDSWPVLMTNVSPALEDLFGKLHRQCDWVITADRNAGVEYFDSPEALSKVYDAYLIDCVPERDDLGFLQLITSTACLDEVTGIFAEALGGMGLSSSSTNCSFLLNALKALSGRLALRLAGSGMVVQEMIALALTQSHCIDPSSDRSKWPSLAEGFFVPLDDVPDLLKLDQLKKLDEKNSGEAERRADLLYVTAEKRGGLRFAFYEVKYRNTLRSARSQDMCESVQGQLDASCKRWDARFGEGISTLERTLRRASLAKTLRFYVAKARRHGLSEDAFVRISREIERMLRDPSTVTIPSMVQATDTRQGFVFCPEYAGKKPDELAHMGDAKLWLFGPNLLPEGNCSTPDSFPDESTELSLSPAPEQTTRQEATPSLNTDISIEPETVRIPVSIEPSRAVINLGTGLPGELAVDWMLGTNGNPHLLIVGQPGMGKTHCLIRVCQQLYEQGIVPIVFSFHQDIDEKLMETVPGGVQTVSYEGLGFNPMEVIATHPQAYVESVDMLRDVFSAIFPDLGEVQLGSLRKALKKSYEDQGWASDGSRGKTPDFGDFLGILQATPKVDQKMLNRLEELADYGFFSAQHGSPSLLDATRPTLVQIHSRQNDTLQRAFATFVLYNIYQSMFKRGPLSHLTHAIVFDEAHRAAKLKLIPTMAKECRKFGLSLILASQEIKDFDQSLFAAVSNSLTLRLLEADAQKMAKNFGIPYDKVKLYADRIKQMPKFQGLFNREGLREPVRVALGA
ncbi:MAG: hypothetical protein PHQ05_13990 [Sterolibacterium sp.]|nr:hypothetical protein [Sterolibacterium sp.]